MERSEKIKETQYLWRFEKEGMLQADKDLYRPLIEVMDPLFESGIVTYDEWVDKVESTLKACMLDPIEERHIDTADARRVLIEKVWDSLISYYKQFNKE